MESFSNANPYNYCLQNPVNLIDPYGMAPTDDYRLFKNGNVMLLRRTNSTTDTFYNHDMSSSITVSKDFVSSHPIGAVKGDMAVYTAQEKSRQSFYLSAKDINNSENIYKFIADNAYNRNEYSLMEFSNNRNNYGYISSSNEIGQVRGENEFISNILYSNSSTKLTKHTHSHPHFFDKEYYNYPAYPSGFNPTRLLPTISARTGKPFGDRGFFGDLKSNFGDRIPNSFNIYLPALPNLTLKYDFEKVYRVGLPD